MKEKEKKYPLEIVLFEIYRMRVLSIEQLNKVIFENEDYGKRYLKKAEKDGYIAGKILMKGRKRLAKVYYCTEKGMDYLEERELIRKYGKEIKIKTEEKGKQYSVMSEKGKYVPLRVDVNTNIPTREQMSMVYHTNNLYAALMPYGIHYYDSREWKIMHSMNRNTMVRGGLKMRDGRFYAVYAFFSSEELSNAKLKESMLNRLVNEIKETPSIKNYVIFCYSPQIYEQVYEYFFNDPVTRANEMLLVSANGMLDYGMEQLKLYSHAEEHKKSIESVLNARLYGETELENKKASVFADWLVDIDGETHYVVNTLNMNILNLIWFNKNYYKEMYKADGTPVIIPYWNPGHMTPFIQDIARQKEYVKLIAVPVKEKIKRLVEEREILGEWTNKLPVQKLQNPNFK
ncbi:hypothetical protein [Psychrobacillus sp. FSL H8-0487]|uniref:hypothetical protein n=1 Tax=Psychrobacillus sp. FSL H8-0487 TaxID=2921391 RepID=UPI0030FA54BC